VTLLVAEERTFEFFVNPSNLAFRAAVALYPPCSLAGARPVIPTLIPVWGNSTTGRQQSRAQLRAGETRDHRFSLSPTPVLTIRSMHPAFSPVE
jgi:hypothetical protein